MCIIFFFFSSSQTQTEHWIIDKTFHLRWMLFQWCDSSKNLTCWRKNDERIWSSLLNQKESVLLKSFCWIIFCLLSFFHVYFTQSFFFFVLIMRKLLKSHADLSFFWHINSCASCEDKLVIYQISDKIVIYVQTIETVVT